MARVDFSFKINRADLKQLQISFGKGFPARYRKTFLNKIGRFTLTRIKALTRFGKSQATGRRFKGLSESYKAFRRGQVYFYKDELGRVRKVPARSRLLSTVDGKYFFPNKSNLTFTGQLIKSLRFRTNVRRNTVTVFPVGRRKDGQSNKTVAGHVADGGRPFLGLDAIGKRKLKQLILRETKRALKKSGLRVR